ncbi:MAG: ROK family protein, partial [Ilumatobacteraceae bacterium]
MSRARRAGIDVGGTKCLGVVLDASGQLVGEWRRPTPKTPDALIETLVLLAGEMAPFDSLGVGVPGLVTRSGTLRAAPHLLEVSDFEVGALLTARLGLDVRVDNDATCATAAEWRLGAGVGSDDLVMVTLGTGIGGGVVAGGRLVRGAHGFTGEFGHMVVDPTGPPCPCGRRGCWERYASGTALARLGREAAE